MDGLGLCLALVGGVVFGGPLPADTAILYDGAEGKPLDQQTWLYVTRPILVAKAQRSFADGFTRLDSTPVMGEWAGFLSRLHVHNIELSHPDMPDLDRRAGYTVRFRVRVAAEGHKSNHRAGFSVVVVGNDLQAIELGFWPDEIWAQSGPNHLLADQPLFTHTVEGIKHDTSRMALYELRVFDNGYSLWLDQRPLLRGPLRDYSSHWHPVYRQPNTIFLGDNTSRASAVVEISYVAVSTERVPSPK